MTKKIIFTGEKWNFKLSNEMPDIHTDFTDNISLPSTVQQEKKPPLTDERSDGFLTDPYRFEGYALYERTVNISPDKSDSEIFFVMERTRTSHLWIDGKYAGSQNSLCAPHKYNITEYCTQNPIRISIVIDNKSCPVPGGHMTSQDTQTNWLGITGEIYIEYCEKLRFENINLYPDIASGNVTVRGDVVGGDEIELTAEVKGFPKKKVKISKENPSFVYELKGAELWSEHNPVTYTMHISCNSDDSKIPFGMREFSTSGRELLLNGEKIFLRGKHDGMIFPLTGAAPTDIESWLQVLKTAKEYGINHYRFHTCCPPEAAFYAADKLGIYLEPELPFWGTVEEELTEGQQYLIDEGFRILNSFGNHPSFFALSLGNELWGSKDRLNAILGDYKRHDSRHLYTQGSNNFQFRPCTVENDDFFVGVRFSRERLYRGSYAMCDAPQGHIQTDAPNSEYSYDENICPESIGSSENVGGTIEIQYGTGVKTVAVNDTEGEFISEIPVISHEVGQYFMYPDYNEIEKYKGVLKPYNFEIFRERLENAGLLSLADKYFHASGRFAAECYKNEIEAALRSKELSGFQLLDLQDFTGQGTALVGILNAFMENKGIITAKEWRNFCSDKVILGCMPKFVYSSDELLSVDVKLYHYAQNADVDPTVNLRLATDEEIIADTTVTAVGSVKSGVFDIGTAEISLSDIMKPCKATLTLRLDDICNEYILWLYPNEDCRMPEHLIITDKWEDAKTSLSKGEKVLFLPCRINESHSIEGTYCTDFWNYPMFSSISESMNKPLPVGTLGLLIDNNHKALSCFPSEIYSTAQWYDIVIHSRALMIDGLNIDPIVRTIDNCKRNHSLATVFEVNAGNGKLLVCTAALESNKSPACRALLNSLMQYASSEDFSPVQTVDIKDLDRFFSAGI